MPAAPFQVRPAREGDRCPLAELFAAVAEERDGIATEPPVDLDARAASWDLEWIFVAIAADDVIGLVHLDPSRFGYCDIALAVAREWRGRGVGTALFETGIASARDRGCHKLCLSVFRSQHRRDRPLPQARLRRGGTPRQAVSGARAASSGTRSRWGSCSDDRRQAEPGVGQPAGSRPPRTPQRQRRTRPASPRS